VVAFIPVDAVNRKTAGLVAAPIQVLCPLTKFIELGDSERERQLALIGAVTQHVQHVSRRMPLFEEVHLALPTPGQKRFVLDYIARYRFVAGYFKGLAIAAVLGDALFLFVSGTRSLPSVLPVSTAHSREEQEWCAKMDLHHRSPKAARLQRAPIAALALALKIDYLVTRTV
jgi:hypothetical protein